MKNRDYLMRLLELSIIFDNWFNAKLSSALKVRDYTIAQMKVFKFVHSHPEGVMLREIADELQITPSAASQTVSRLAREGILSQKANPQNRRASIITVAAKGMAMYEKSKATFIAAITPLLRDIPDDAMDSFLDILNVISSRILADAESKTGDETK